MDKVIKMLDKKSDNGFYAEINDDEIIIDCDPEKNTIKVKARGTLAWPVAIGAVAAALLTIINKMDDNDEPLDAA